MSRNEEVRVGTALYVALEKIKERVEAGEEPRQDGLFDVGTDPRGMLEGTLLTAARSYDEMKVPYMGAFYASFVFDEKTGIDEAHFLLSLWDRLTFHELCVLAYFADDDHAEYRLYLQAAAEEEGLAMTHMLAAELTQLTGLGLIGVRLGDGSVTEFGATAGTVGSGGGVLMKTLGSLAPTALGKTFVSMAELEKIPEADQQEVGTQLRGNVD